MRTLVVFAILVSTLTVASQSLIGQTPPNSEGAKGLVVQDMSQVAAAGERWAILIGVDEYDESNGWPKLDYCARDMARLRDTLIHSAGYSADHIQLFAKLPDAEASEKLNGVNVRFTKEPSCARIEIALGNFLKRAKPEDTALIAFSGHGYSDGTTSYIVPVDGSKEKEYIAKTMISIEAIQNALKDSPARQKVLIIDACHSGKAKGDGANVEAASPMDWSKIPQGTGMAEFFSCAEKEVSWEDSKLQQGVFTYYMTEGISGKADEAGNHDGLVTADELNQYVYAAVREHTRTKPRQQNPVAILRQSGPIILGSVKNGVTALPDNEIIQKLAALELQGRIPKDFRVQATNWLTAGDASKSARTVRTSLSLLARREISTEQFSLLAGNATHLLDERRQAAANLEDSQFRAVIVGIDTNGTKYCESEAKAFASLLQEHRPKDKSGVTLLTGEHATKDAVVQSVKSASKDLKKGDVLFLYLSTMSAKTGVQLEAPVQLNGNVHPAGNHRGLGLGSISVGIAARGDLSGVGDTAPLFSGETYAAWAVGVLNITKGVTEIGPNTITMDDFAFLDSCSAHIVVISSSCHVFPRRTPLLMRYDSVDARPARVFIGYQGLARESEQMGGTYLGSTVRKALEGRADSGIQDSVITIQELVNYVKKDAIQSIDISVHSTDPLPSSPLTISSLRPDEEWLPGRK